MYSSGHQEVFPLTWNAEAAKDDVSGKILTWLNLCQNGTKRDNSDRPIIDPRPN